MVEEILKFHDKEFIDSAYQNILGRLPDSHEVDGYRDMLRGGIDKRVVLLAIWRSEPVRRPLPPELDRALTALQTEMKRERGFRGKMERGGRLERQIHQFNWKIHQIGEKQGELALQTDVGFAEMRQTFDELSGWLTRLGSRVDNVGQQIHEKTYPNFVHLQQTADELQRSIEDKLGALEARIEATVDELSEQLTRLGARVDNVGQEIHEKTYPNFVHPQHTADELQRSIEDRLGALEARVQGRAGQLEPVVCRGGSTSIASMADLPGGAQRLVRRVRSLMVR
ncbi:uncharacterized protein DUF4214 [Nitrospirillum amazonense]|uniref:Uncharacterized protein DUF4214 n=1 Tax=Nitrospirillum amazonense TaxID=28077 RepID=A0A560FSI7_9PROT|nr:DUF4214 domain-containing protein [Nitrospirillum amazonense]TWB24579.1 uncharacterized protein DUF4214 [Nitrospirillum amazonense]